MLDLGKANLSMVKRVSRGAPLRGPARARGRFAALAFESAAARCAACGQQIGQTALTGCSRSWQMQPPSTRNAKLNKPELGTKRVCPSCSVRFYDLQKRPIECPKCGFEFEPEMLLKQRRTRLPEEAKETPAAKAEDEEELETAEEEEAGEGAGDEEELEEDVPSADEPMVEADMETEEEDAEGAAETETVEPEEFEEDIEGEEDEDDELLEEVEEDEDDVSGIIDTDIEKDEP